MTGIAIPLSGKGCQPVSCSLQTELREVSYLKVTVHKAGLSGCNRLWNSIFEEDGALVNMEPRTT
jgi:hypothetical protein